MIDNTELLRRIEALRLDRGFSFRRLCLDARISVDWFKLRRKGHPPKLRDLRALADTLDCDRRYLEEAATDIRLDSGSDDTLAEWLNIYETVPAPRRAELISTVRAIARLMDATTEAPLDAPATAKRGRR